MKNLKEHLPTIAVIAWFVFIFIFAYYVTK